jgi:hypothetical protein
VLGSRAIEAEAEEEVAAEGFTLVMGGSQSMAPVGRKASEGSFVIVVGAHFRTQGR